MMSSFDEDSLPSAGGPSDDRSDDPIEVFLEDAFHELLDARPIGRTDDFLALGGHSLLAVQLMVRVREVFEVEISVAEFFRAPTVRSLADLVIERQIAGMDEAELAALQQGLDERDGKAAFVTSSQGEPHAS